MEKSNKKFTNKEFLEKLKKDNPLFYNNVEILSEYDGNKVKIKYKCMKCGECFYQVPYVSYNAKQCPVCKKFFTEDFHNKRIESFYKKFREKGNKNIEVIGDYIDCKTKIKCRCKKDLKHEFYMTPDKIINRGHGCPICSGSLCVDGINSVADIRPDLIKYFIDEKDAHKYTVYSNKQLFFRCKDCGKIKNKRISINTLSTYGFSCNNCNNNKLSFPNRILRAFLIQLKEKDIIEEWNTEYCPQWIYPYRYDGYLKNNKNKILLEFDGRQHFVNDGSKYYRSNIKEIDEIKNKKAKSNGYIIIRIDCTKSNFDYIKTNIINSDLKKYVDFSLIDWEIIELSINKNLMKEICEAYNNGDFIPDLKKKFNLCVETIRSSLKRGAKLGLTDYSIQNYKDKKSRKKYIVSIYDLDENLLVENLLLRESVEWLKEKTGRQTIRTSPIIQCLEKKKENYLGYIFKNKQK